MRQELDLLQENACFSVGEKGGGVRFEHLMRRISLIGASV